MKKLFSLTTAAIIAASVSLSAASYAGSVTTKGDTQVQLYGFTYAEFALDKQTANLPDISNMPKPDANASSSVFYKSTYNKMNSQAESWCARLGLNFKNKEENISGKIVGDFKGKSANGEGNFRIRQAWVGHKFNNFKVKIGQAYILEEMHSTISMASVGPAGFEFKMKRVPLVAFFTSFDAESANLQLSLAFEYSNNKAVSAGKDSVNTALSVDRYVFPTTAARAVLTFDTGFGAPAKVYGWGSLIPVYVSDKTRTKVSDNSETSYAFGVGVRLPVSVFKIGLNYHRTDGATGYSGLSDYKPSSYYLDDNVAIEKTTTNAYNINLVMKPTKPLSIGAEYDYVKFNNNVFSSDPKAETLIANIKIKTTKVTMLGLEWRHMKAKNFDIVGAGDDNFSGDQIYAIYKYMF